MNKAELIRELSNKTSLNQSDCAKFLDALTQTLTEAMSKGETIQFIGFGSFSVIDTKERSGRNPSNGKVITIPAGKRVRFSVGKKLKDALHSTLKKSVKAVKTIKKSK